MEENLYWVKVKMLRDTQAPNRCFKCVDRFICCSARKFESEPKKMKSEYYSDAEIESICRL